MNKTFKQKNEQGRSMVEMLGVLAVIGVLSVAGIAGYNTAMQSYRTNEILNATSMFYVLAMSQNQGNGPSGKIDYSKVGGTNPSGATLEYENNAITITFNDAKDCTAAKNKLGDKATDDCANKKLNVTFGETLEDDLPLSMECNYENDGKKACIQDGSYYQINVCVCASPIDCYNTPSELDRYSDSKCKQLIPYDCTNPSAYEGDAGPVQGYYCFCRNNTWTDCSYIE